jgi:redox-sensitive bicupin YhaK (pirin superfamily)
MIRPRPASKRGQFRNHWLDARFSFHFGGWQAPGFEAYSDLLVLNDDRVAPGEGFAEHPHADVEVMSMPIAGTIEHRDSLGHVQLMRPGDVHLMRAGRGIRHSEMNASPSEPEHHLQWWIRPAARGLEPAYQHIHVPAAEKLDRWRLVASPQPNAGTLTLAQDARVLLAHVQGQALRYQPGPRRWTYLHVATGRLSVAGHELAAGDALSFEDGANVLLIPLGNADGPGADVLLFDLRDPRDPRDPRDARTPPAAPP